MTECCKSCGWDINGYFYYDDLLDGIFCFPCSYSKTNAICFDDCKALFKFDNSEMEQLNFRDAETLHSWVSMCYLIDAEKLFCDKYNINVDDECIVNKLLGLHGSRVELIKKYFHKDFSDN